MAADPEPPQIPATMAIAAEASDLEVRVRRLHRRDINKVWEFLKRVFMM